MRPDAIPAADKEQMNESVDRRAVADDDERAVLRIRRIECGQSVPLVVGIVRVVSIEHRMRSGLAHGQDFHARRSARHISKSAVVKNELGDRVVAARNVEPPLRRLSAG